jgi:hypothetical protein
MRLGKGLKTGNYLGKDLEKLGLHLRVYSQFFITEISKIEPFYFGNCLYTFEVVDITENGGLLSRSILSKFLSFKKSRENPRTLKYSEIPICILVDYFLNNCFDEKTAKKFPDEGIFLKNLKKPSVSLLERFVTKDTQNLIYSMKRENLNSFLYCPIGSKLENLSEIFFKEKFRKFFKHITSFAIDGQLSS